MGIQAFASGWFPKTGSHKVEIKMVAIFIGNGGFIPDASHHQNCLDHLHADDH